MLTGGRSGPASRFTAASTVPDPGSFNGMRSDVRSSAGRARPSGKSVLFHGLAIDSGDSVCGLRGASGTIPPSEGQKSCAPSGTARSGPINTIAPSASGKPSTSTSDMKGPICFGGKLTTAAT